MVSSVECGIHSRALAPLVAMNQALSTWDCPIGCPVEWIVGDVCSEPCWTLDRSAMDAENVVVSEECKDSVDQSRLGTWRAIVPTAVLR